MVAKDKIVLVPRNSAFSFPAIFLILLIFMIFVNKTPSVDSSLIEVVLLVIFCVLTFWVHSFKIIVQNGVLTYVTAIKTYNAKVKEILSIKSEVGMQKTGKGSGFFRFLVNSKGAENFSMNMVVFSDAATSLLLNTLLAQNKNLKLDLVAQKFKDKDYAVAKALVIQNYVLWIILLAIVSVALRLAFYFFK